MKPLSFGDVVQLAELSQIKQRRDAINVLCVGSHDEAMKNRRSLLEQAGYSVFQASDLRRVIAACTANTLAVAILGQHLPSLASCARGCRAAALWRRSSSGTVRLPIRRKYLMKPMLTSRQERQLCRRVSHSREPIQRRKEQDGSVISGFQECRPDRTECRAAYHTSQPQRHR